MYRLYSPGFSYFSYISGSFGGWEVLPLAPRYAHVIIEGRANVRNVRQSYRVGKEHLPAFAACHTEGVKYKVEGTWRRR